ncbi:MAG: 5-(carboxyamino)imidazole ribonucleotide mutase [Armatimonadota bacterium]
MRVAVLMGSDSDLSVMQPAIDVLKEFGIEHEVKVCSAHRTPDAAAEFARTAAERGVSVIIAGAGAAAHLPGVLAAYTTLPVIGVPIDASPLNGLDSLYSMVQMPSGVPVATVGINASKNAAILAAQMLALSDEGVSKRLEEHKEQLAAGVEERERKIGFLARMRESD